MGTQDWILPGINRGFIQRDLSDLPVTAVDLDNAIIDFPRGKTAVERRCPLWLETVAALKASAAKRWASGSPELDKLFFVMAIQGYKRSYGFTDPATSLYRVIVHGV